MDFNYRDYEVSSDWEKSETTEPAYLKSMDAPEEDDQMSFELSDLMEDTQDSFEDHSDEPTERLDIEDAFQPGNNDLIQQPVTITIEQPKVNDVKKEMKQEKKSLFGFGKKKKSAKPESDDLEDTDLEDNQEADQKTETADMQAAASEMKSMFEERKDGEVEKETALEIEEEKAEPEKKDAGTKKIWICKSCGTENSGKFCMECGEKKPRSEYWQCPVCGTESKGKFCPECGTKRND